MKSDRSIRKTMILFFAFCAVAMSILLGAMYTYGMKLMTETSLKKYETAKGEGYQTELQSEVETAMSVIQAEYDRYQAGELTLTEAKNEAKEIIRSMRYREDESGYFWIDGTDYKLVMHPLLSSQEGSSRKELEDENGVKIIQNIVSAVTGDSDSGFTQYDFEKSDGVTVATKLTYSKLFKPWGWIVSTGSYTDEMLAETTQVEADINNSYKNIRWITLAVNWIIVLLIINSGRVLGNQICTPITKLAEHAKVVATGKIDTDISRVSGTNELAVLQNSFCDMIDNFKSQAEVINRVASGDLCVDVNVKSGDDVVGNALAKLVNDNNEVFTNVQNVANEIREGSSHIAAASQHLAQGSTEQASAIEQITASVTGIANQSRTNAAKVDEVRHIILEAGQHTADGNEKMKEMVTAMNEINASSHNIQKVIKVMNDIAFNTNILALNASVEASRAGAQGKGFAVVAEEVRNLAEHSAEAAGKIEEMIADSLQKVSHGSELVEDTEKALELISASIGQITDLSNDVAEASEEQAEVAGQIDEALQQVSSVVQMNSAASEQCAASSEELSNQANELNHQLAQFQLKGDRFY